jgi:hypothetical protein
LHASGRLSECEWLAKTMERWKRHVGIAVECPRTLMEVSFSPLPSGDWYFTFREVAVKGIHYSSLNEIFSFIDQTIMQLQQ